MPASVTGVQQLAVDSCGISDILVYKKRCLNKDILREEQPEPGRPVVVRLEQQPAPGYETPCTPELNIVQWLTNATFKFRPRGAVVRRTHEYAIVAHCEKVALAVELNIIDGHIQPNDLGAAIT